MAERSTALVHALPELGAQAANDRLGRVLEQRREDIAIAWLAGAGPDVVARFPDLDRYLLALLAGLTDVFRGSGWALTQTIIDGLAERRARLGPGLEQGLQRILLAGRHAIRPFYSSDCGDECDEVLLEALHECVLRFSESYEGIRMSSESERVHTRIIKALVSALEARDPYTKGHSISVALLSQRAAQTTSAYLDPTQVFLAGLLHDVGKVGIPDSILLKPGPLSSAQWKVMQSHPVMSANILRPIRIYPDIADAAHAHHENIDGSGYPKGLAGSEIPPIARIIRVADSFDAMTASRAHRPGRSVDDALQELEAGKNTLYDPDAVDSVIHLVETPGVVRELNLASLQIDLGAMAPTFVG